tara:strand:- start:767 stop:1312 length:546 start_codon:yes stop_codon:yes gene_type:complete
MGKKNTIGGKGYKKKKACSAEFDRKLLELAEAGQSYALVTKMLGGCRVDCTLYGNGAITSGKQSSGGGGTGTNAIGVIRGAMRKKVYINTSDVILVSVRDFEPGKVDVIHKYSNDEVRELIKLKEIPSNIHDSINSDGTGGEINFADESDGESKEGDRDDVGDEAFGNNEDLALQNEIFTL